MSKNIQLRERRIARMVFPADIICRALGIPKDAMILADDFHCIVVHDDLPLVREGEFIRELDENTQAGLMARWKRQQK